MLPNKQAANNIKITKRLFLAEIIVVLVLAVTFDGLNDLGLGGIIFVLPLLCAYILVLTATVALPILAFGIIKNKLAQNTADYTIVCLAGVVNVIAAIIFAGTIIQMVFQPGTFEGIRWQDIFFLIF